MRLFRCLSPISPTDQKYIQEDDMKKIDLSEHFTCSKLLLYSLPTIGNALAITSFQLIDGSFVANMLGVTPFAAVNLVSPLFFMFYAIGFMFGSGTSALVSQYMGQNDLSRGQRVFSISMVTMMLVGLVLGTAATVFLPGLLRMIGTSETMIPYCVEYGRMMMIFLPFHLINAAFLTLWITAGKSVLGFGISIVNGCGNVFLDWLFMGPLDMGIGGAALASSIAATLTAVIIFCYFCHTRTSSLRFVRFSFQDIRELWQICYNGLSEMVDSAAGNLTGLVINRRLLLLFGEIGVAAMGVFGYVIEVFMALFLGVSETAITVVGYKYGEKNRMEIDDLLKKGLRLMLAVGVVAGLLCFVCAPIISELYLGKSDEALQLAMHVLRVSAIGCLFYGFNIFCSSFFTGLGDGLSSMLISGMMSVACPIALIYVLPELLGRDAIWFATPVTTVITAVLCVALIQTRFVGLMNRMDSQIDKNRCN